jgi:hypothetical protein
VVRDVVDGWVTVERARDVYGVVLDADGRVDERATRRLRAELAARASESPAAGDEAAAEARAVHGGDGDQALTLIAPGAQPWPTVAPPT